jgi:lysophospholipase L1-like esterase
MVRALLVLLLVASLAAADRVVVCYGDSITFADWKEQGVGAGTRWVDRVGATVAGVRMVNAGKNGRTTEDAAGLRTALAANPGADLVVIMLGTNDLKDIADATAAVKACASRVGALVDQVKAAQPRAAVLLCAPIRINRAALTDYWRKKGFGATTEQALALLPAAYAAVAKAKGVRFAAMHDAVDPARLPDGVHPDAAGHAQLAVAMAGAIATALRR